MNVIEIIISENNELKQKLMKVLMIMLKKKFNIEIYVRYVRNNQNN